MRALIYIFIVVVFLFIGACSSIKNPDIISIEKVELIENADTDIIISAEIKLYNPNWVKLSGNDVSLSIFIDTSYIGVAEIIDDIVIAKHDTSNVSFILKIQKDCLSSDLNIKDSINVHILGSTNMPYTGKKFYFELDYKLDISDYVMPIADEFIKEGDIQIKDVKIKSIDLMEIKLEVLFNLENKTKIEYQISKLDVQIYTSPSYTTLVGGTSIDESFTVFSDTLNVFKSNVNVNTLSMGSALFSNTMNSSNSFYIKVNSIVNYNNIEIPFTIKRRVDYNPLTLEIELHE